MNPFLFRRIRGPVFLLCFAFTAILAQWHILSFARSWPIYLLAAGLLRLLEAVLPAPVYVAPSYGGAPAVRRRPSLTFAIAELAIGTVALLITTDVLSFVSFWHVYALWWPLLLVVLGVLLLIERLFDRGGPSRQFAGTGVSVGRPRRSGGLIPLVVLLILLGLSSRSIPFAGMDDWHNWHVGPDTDWSFLNGGEAHENDVSFEQPLAADAALTIDNARGDLRIAPSTDGLIHVNAHQTAHVPDRDKERAFAASKPVFSAHGASAALSVPGRNGVDVQLVLLVPESVLCTVRNHHGDIAVSGLRRTLEIHQDHGDVALDSLGGAVHLTMDHGDVHARALASDLLVDGRADDITVSDVKGKTQLHGEFFGDTQVDGVGGPVEFHSNRTQLDAGRLTGQLSLDGKNLRIAGAQGGLKITTRSKDVEVTDLSGDAQITDSNSDLSVATRQPLGAMSLENSTGNITLSVPAAANFSIDGSTGKDDEINSEFALTQNAANGGKTVSGQVGQGGPRIEIKTLHGDLTLRRSTPDTEQPEKPERPEHVRHLRNTGEPPAPIVQ
jgi:hypothetical protein